MGKRTRAMFKVLAISVLGALLIATFVHHLANQSRAIKPPEHQPNAATIPPLNFSMYPAGAASLEPLQVRLDFSKPSMKPFRRFRTLMQNAVADGRANIAGHYKLVDIPCGSGCHYWWLVDLRSGQIHKTPSEEPVRFDEAITQPGSRLVLFKGPDLPRGHRCQFAYYEWLERERIFRGIKQGALRVDC
jgi:hypothetical protein